MREELQNKVERAVKLKAKGFDVGLSGRLITLPLSSFSAFDDV